MMHHEDAQHAPERERHRQPARYDRRTVLRGALGAAGAGLLLAQGTSAQQPTPPPPTSATPAATPASAAASIPVTVFPRPNSRTASPSTEITFRGLGADALGPIKVVGSQSGGHSGFLRPHSDDHGASYLVDAPFWPGEQVTVQTGLNIPGGENGTYRFTVAQPLAAPVGESSHDRSHPKYAQHFHSRPDLVPPPMAIATPAHNTAPGYIFLGTKTPDGQGGPMIIDNSGQIVWYAPLALDIASVNDVRVQQYRGQPVITWWQGVSAGGHGLGHYEIVDSAYRPVTEVHVANGYAGADLHEFIITPQHTAIFTVYNIVRWDLTSVGSTQSAATTDGIVQEIDLATGRVLFEWHALDHVAPDECYLGPPKDPTTYYDYFHVNSISFAPDGNLIISARNTWTIYKLDRQTGDVIWRLGGKRSDFKMGPGTQTSYQHDAQLHANGTLTIFDNGAVPQVEKQSRGVVIAVDEKAKTATLARQYTHPGGILSGSQGNLQTLPNGNVLVGWGDNPNFTEYSADGTILFDGHYPPDDYSYRTYRFEWTGLPREAPAIAAERGANNQVTVYASWNGATEVASWQVLAGAAPGKLQPVGEAPRSGFETAITVQTGDPYVAVAATDAAGKVIGSSTAIKTA